MTTRKRAAARSGGTRRHPRTLKRSLNLTLALTLTLIPILIQDCWAASNAGLVATRQPRYIDTHGHWKAGRRDAEGHIITATGKRWSPAVSKAGQKPAPS